MVNVGPRPMATVIVGVFCNISEAVSRNLACSASIARDLIVRTAGDGIGRHPCWRQPFSDCTAADYQRPHVYQAPRSAVSIANREGRLQWMVTFPLREHVSFVYHHRCDGNLWSRVACPGEGRRQATLDR